MIGAEPQKFNCRLGQLKYNAGAGGAEKIRELRKISAGTAVCRRRVLHWIFVNQRQVRERRAYLYQGVCSDP